jgi:hypothetical protein
VIQLAAELPRRVDERVGQDAAQPAGLLGRRVAAELLAVLVRLDQRLLHDVGRIDLAGQARVELEPRQQVQVVAVVLDGSRRRLRGSGHARLPGERDDPVG